MPIVPLRPLGEGLDIAGSFARGKQLAAQERQLKMREQREQRAARMQELREQVMRRQMGEQERELQMKRAQEAVQMPELLAPHVRQVPDVSAPSLEEQTQALGLREQDIAARGAEGAPALQETVPLEGATLTQRAEDQALAGPPVPDIVRPELDVAAAAEGVGTRPEFLQAARRQAAESAAQKRTDLTAKIAERARRMPPDRREAFLKSPFVQERVQRGLIDEIPTDDTGLDAMVALGEISGAVKPAKPLSKEGEQIADAYGIENFNTPEGRLKIQNMLAAQARIKKIAAQGDAGKAIKTIRDDWTKSSVYKNTDEMSQFLNKILAMKPENRADQLGALVGYTKILDPGSVAREGEVQLTASVMSLLEKMKVAADKVHEGGVLSEDAVRDYQASAERLFEAQMKSFRKSERFWRNEASLSGLDPSRISPPLSLPKGFGGGGEELSPLQKEIQRLKREQGLE